MKIYVTHIRISSVLKEKVFGSKKKIFKNYFERNPFELLKFNEALTKKK